MKNKELIKKLEKENKELEIFMPISTGIGNISEVNKVKKSSYGFFGKSIKCILLEN